MVIETRESTPSIRRDGECASSHQSVPGWSADLDRANRPAVPYERRLRRLQNVHWDRPERQSPTVEIPRSNERQGPGAVFGTTSPPAGVSGRIRRAAFRYWKSDLHHWLLLLAADCVNVLEGLGRDRKRAFLPNVFTEAGAGAASRHGHGGTIRRIAVVGVVVAGVGAWLWARSPRRA
jgi:hypothetical protein